MRSRSCPSGSRAGWELLHEDNGALHTTFALSHVRLGLGAHAGARLLLRAAARVSRGDTAPIRPGPGLILAAVFAATGSDTPAVARLAVIAFQLGSIACMVMLLRRLFGVGAALLGGAVMATLPMGAFFGRMVNYEPLCLFAVMLQLCGVCDLEAGASAARPRRGRGRRRARRARSTGPRSSSPRPSPPSWRWTPRGTPRSGPRARCPSPCSRPRRARPPRRRGAPVARCGRMDRIAEALRPRARRTVGNAMDDARSVVVRPGSARDGASLLYRCGAPVRSRGRRGAPRLAVAAGRPRARSPGTWPAPTAPRHHRRRGARLCAGGAHVGTHPRRTGSSMRCRSSC